MRNELPELRFAVEYGRSLALEHAYPTLEMERHGPSDVRRVCFAELVAEPAVKLLVGHAHFDSKALAALLSPHADGFELTHSTPDGPGLLEISARGVSKASGLAGLCAQRGIGADEVMAFGDMPNDLPMLMWAGRPYAMANAHPDVLGAMIERAPSNDEDGVAVVLEQWF
jgi:hypothetical protein